MLPVTKKGFLKGVRKFNTEPGKPMSMTMPKAEVNSQKRKPTSLPVKSTKKSKT